MQRKALFVLCCVLLISLLVGTVQAQETPVATEEATMGGLYATTNPAELENDSVVALTNDLSATGATFTGFSDIANVQSVWFTSNGNAYVTVDVTAEDGGFVVLEGLANNEGMDAVMPARTVSGQTAAGLIAPKGLQVIENLELVLIANNGPANVKAFNLDADGDVEPAFVLQDFGDFGGSVWDIYYSAETDQLFVAGTTGAVFVYDDFSVNLGASTLTNTIIPSDADGTQISVNLHGIYYDAASDTLLLTDVGSADSNTDGQIFTITNASMATGNTPVTLQIMGDQTMLGNPVDLAFDGANLYVAEKANDVVLRYDDILELSGSLNQSADVSLTVTKPESLAYTGGIGIGEEMSNAEMGTIVDIAMSSPDFSTLVTAVQAAGLVDVLADPDAEWTVFAPTNDAFAALPEGVLDMLLADTELLTRVLTYHVIEDAVTSDMLSDMMAPSMEMTAPGADLMGSELQITIGDDGTVMVNDATVVMADIRASNGVIHVIDSVLVPPEILEMLGE